MTEPTTTTIRCNTPTCARYITTDADLTETQARRMARAAGWYADAIEPEHRCPAHHESASGGAR